MKLRASLVAQMVKNRKRYEGEDLILDFRLNIL